MQLIYEQLDGDSNEVVAQQIVSILHADLPYIAIHGCISLDPRQVPLASAVATTLGLPAGSTTDSNGAKLALNVKEAQTFLATRDAAVPQWSPSYLYSILHDHYGNFPCSEELRNILCIDDSTVLSIIPSFPWLDVLLPHVKQIYRVYTVVWRRKLLGAFVFDYVSIHGKLHENAGGHAESSAVARDASSVSNIRHSTHDEKTQAGIGEPSSFLNGCNHGQSAEASGRVGNGEFRWPTVLPDDKRDQLIIGAYQCINELDLVSGLFTVDMTFNAVSAKLLRIIPCLDIASCAGEIQSLKTACGAHLFAYAMLIACNLKPILPVAASFQNHLRARRPNFRHRAFDLSRLADVVCGPL